MAYTIESLQAKIEEIDEKLEALTQGELTDYKIGEEEVTKSVFSKHLLSLRKQYSDDLLSMSSESIDSLSYELNEFGIDMSEYGD